MRGLTDVGNSGLAAALHCLLWAPPLANYVRGELCARDTGPEDTPAARLAREVAALAEAYWAAPAPASPPRAADPTGVATALRSPPRDAHEAFVSLLDALHEAWRRRTPPIEPSPATGHVVAEAWAAANARDGYSFVTECFQGQTETTAKDARSVSHFRCLTVEPASSVEKAIADALRPRDPGSPEVTRFTYLPVLLAVHIRRFDAHGAKTDRFVSYSTALRWTTVDTSVCAYDLYAVVFHADGRYTVACEAGGTWYEIDGDRATELDNINKVVRKDAYMLMYKKRV